MPVILTVSSLLASLAFFPESHGSADAQRTHPRCPVSAARGAPEVGVKAHADSAVWIPDPSLVVALTVFNITILIQASIVVSVKVHLDALETTWKVSESADRRVRGG